MVTPAMQTDLREIIAWHARTCHAALVDGVFKVWPPYTLGMRWVGPKMCTVLVLQVGLNWGRGVKL